MDCGGCGARLGELHNPGCDVERCPRCGHQAISCGCVYVVNGLDRGTLEEEHPDIFCNGPTAAMYERWDAEWGARRLSWAGEWPGLAECREYGLYCRETGRGLERCGPDAPGATEDLNRLVSVGRWDADAGRFVIRGN